MPTTDTVYKAITDAQSLYPSRAGRLIRKLEQFRTQKDNGKNTARLVTSHVRGIRDATLDDQWAGQITDYHLARDLADDIEHERRFAAAWAQATTALAAAQLPEFDADPASVTRWRVAAEHLVHDALVSRPAPARTVQIAAVPRG